MWLFFALPAGWLLLMLLAGVTLNSILYAMCVYRPYPVDGLADDAARVRFYRHEAATQRKVWQAQAKPVLVGLGVAGVICLPVYVLNVMAGIGATLAAVGIGFYLVSRRRKKRTLPWWHGVHFNLELGGFYGMM